MPRILPILPQTGQRPLPPSLAGSDSQTGEPITYGHQDTIPYAISSCDRGAKADREVVWWTICRPQNQPLDKSDDLSHNASDSSSYGEGSSSYGEGRMSR